MKLKPGRAIDKDRRGGPPRKGKQRAKSLRISISVLLSMTLVASLGFTLSGCAAIDAASKAAGEAGNKAENAAAAFTKRFADYKAYEFKQTAAAPETPKATSLSSAENYNQFTDNNYYYHVNDLLSPNTITMMNEQGFAVSDYASWAEYFGVYEQNRYRFVPSFVTTDSATHTFHLMFDHILTELEQSSLSSLLLTLSQQMCASSLAQYEQLKGTEFEGAALRNVAYFATGTKILDASFAVPEPAAELVAQELALIEAGIIKPSAIINYGDHATGEMPVEQIDYSQFAPRSHYNKTPVLQAYFKASKLYGQLTFRSGDTEEVRSALLICNALNDGDNGDLWYRIFEPVNFFVGDCDDITFYQYEQALASTYGGSLADLAAVTDEDSLATALEIIAKLEKPQINSLPIYEDDPDREAIITGFRFLGERFTVDAAIFQRLMDREVEDRKLPKALDIPAAYGSETAISILKDEGVFKDYPDYEAKLKEVQGYVDEISEDQWTSNLYWSWMYMLQPLVDNDTAGLPTFMQSDAWQKKELNTFEGSWTELKHDTLLYSKQPMAEFGGSGNPPPPPDDRGYVEPNPVLYGRLASLCQMTIDGLSSRDMLAAESRTSLEKLLSLANAFTAISEKELTGQELTAEEYDTIRTYGAELEHIWQTTKRDELKTTQQFQYLQDHPGAIVADVATDPNGLVLEEGTGFAKEIYVVFMRDGKPVIGRGVVYSQYEFTVPLSKRMTDEQWHKDLNANKVPAIAPWKLSFITTDSVSSAPLRSRTVS